MFVLRKKQQQDFNEVENYPLQPSILQHSDSE